MRTNRHAESADGTGRGRRELRPGGGGITPAGGRANGGVCHHAASICIHEAQSRSDDRSVAPHGSGGNPPTTGPSPVGTAPHRHRLARDPSNTRLHTPTATRLSLVGSIATRGVLCLLLALLLTGCAATQPKWNPTPASAFDKPIDLQQALALASQQDLRAAEWNARTREAGAAFTQAWLPPNPTLNLGWEDVGLKDIAGKSLTATTTGVSYPVLFWVTRPWEIASARHNRKAAEQALLAEQRDLSIEIGKSWFELATLSRKATLAEEAVKEAGDGVEFARVGLMVGSSSAFDLHRAEAELLRTRAEAADASAAKRAAQLAFAFALGVDRPVYPEVQDAADKDLAVRQPDLDAAPQQPEVKAAAESASAAGNDLTAQYLHVVPLTDVQGGATRKNAPEGQSWAYSLDIPIPLFDWGLAGIARSRAQKQIADVAAERALRDATQRLASAWDHWVAARDKYHEIVEPLQSQSADLAAGAKEMFEAGSMPYTDYLQVCRDTNAAATSAVDAWLDARTAEWTLLCLTQGETGAEGNSGKR